MSAPTINVQALKQLSDNDPKLLIIDVREQDEWDEHHLPMAHHIPKDKIVDDINKLTQDKHAPVYLHCRSGMRSQAAADALIKAGFTDVYSVDGGILAWMNQGYDVI